ncbi:hypothetical protein [Mycobacterium seoulense]|uniref:hypothetical protein n=1 Tax=Mycobacterium seoulense TaxID=386911 RepID=UPI003CEC7717
MTETPDNTPDPAATGTEQAATPPPVDTGPPPGPEPRSLTWWKQKAHDADATGKWLHAELSAENAALKSRVETIQRGYVEHMVAAKLHTPADIWHYVELHELLTDGDVDPAKVNAVDLPVYVQRSPAAPASQVTAADTVDYDADTRTTFADLLKGAARGTRGIATE